MIELLTKGVLGLVFIIFQRYYEIINK